MQRGDYLRKIAALKAIAERAEPMTAEQRTEFQTLDARQRERDFARAAAPAPQQRLHLDHAP